jgi:metallo-beta-lactamase class B
VIDTLYYYASEPEIIDGLKKLGLDPTKIKYVLVTHGHGDHDQGAKMLQDRYGARVGLAAGDWDLIEKRQSMPGGKPKRDLVVTDGQKIVLGDTTVTVVTTPGHSPGSYGLLFSVKDRGRPVSVAYASGTAFTSYDSAFFDACLHHVPEKDGPGCRGSQRDCSAIEPYGIRRRLDKSEACVAPRSGRTQSFRSRR